MRPQRVAVLGERPGLLRRELAKAQFDLPAAHAVREIAAVVDELALAAPVRGRWLEPERLYRFRPSR
jgi:hypothetical protein